MKDAPKNVLKWSTNFLRNTSENVDKNELKKTKISSNNATLILTKV